MAPLNWFVSLVIAECSFLSIEFRRAYFKHYIKHAIIVLKISRQLTSYSRRILFRLSRIFVVRNYENLVKIIILTLLWVVLYAFMPRKQTTNANRPSSTMIFFFHMWISLVMTFRLHTSCSFYVQFLFLHVGITFLMKNTKHSYTHTRWREIEAIQYAQNNLFMEII